MIYVKPHSRRIAGRLISVGSYLRRYPIHRVK